MKATIIMSMIDEAIKRHGVIYPCCKCESLTDTVSEINGHYIFWYNDEQGSTHVIKRKI
jgi:hypothetical protein